MKDRYVKYAMKLLKVKGTTYTEAQKLAKLSEEKNHSQEQLDMFLEEHISSMKLWRLENWDLFKCDHCNQEAVHTDGKTQLCDDCHAELIAEHHISDQIEKAQEGDFCE